METLNKAEFKKAISLKKEVALSIANTKLVNFVSVNKGYFLFKEFIEGLEYFIEIKYDDVSDLTFKSGDTILDVIDADCFEIESAKPNSNERLETLVSWQYE